MKQIILLAFCILVSASDFGVEKRLTLDLQKAKENWSLTLPFLQNIAQLFPVDYFIETGTYLGNTAILAAQVFKQVHTIELSEDLFRKAQHRFKNCENVFAHHGDSYCVLPKILKTLKGSKLIWLDAHYSPNSASTTALGHSVTPIMDELEAIKKNDPLAIIMIDDIRIFCESKLAKSHWQDYPTIKEIYNKIKEINPNYECAIMGDILFVFSQDLHVNVSPIVKACTDSYLFGEEFDGIKAIRAEQTIAENQDSKDMLAYLSGYLDAPYCNMWYGLSLLFAQEYKAALNMFEQAQKNGFKHWRIFWYRSKAFFLLENYHQALRELEMLQMHVSDFSKIQAFECQFREIYTECLLKTANLNRF